MTTQQLQDFDRMIQQIIDNSPKSVMVEYQTPEGYLGYINEEYVDDRPKNTILTGNKKLM